MSKISKEGHEEMQTIKNALNSMFQKLDKIVYKKVKETKDTDVNYKRTNLFNSVREEFEAISNIIEKSAQWEEVK